MKLIPKKVLSGGSFLVASLMASNILNFVYNAYLGRYLTFADFGLITFINTLLSIVSVFLIALGATVNHRTAYLTTKISKASSTEFLIFIQKKTFQIGLIFTVLWLLCSSYISSFFKINSIWPIIIFSVVIILTALKSNNRGYLQSNLLFTIVGIIIFSEPLSKFVSAVILTVYHQTSLVYLSIPISAVISYFVSDFIIRKEIKKQKIDKISHSFSFPTHFFVASIMSGLAANAFLTFDIALVKHYLSPELAGEYSLLALVGKMIYFISALLNIFIITFVSREEGEGKDPHNTFYLLFGGIALMVVGSAVMLGFFGKFFVPMLFGTRTHFILQYLQHYSMTIMLFTLANTIVTFQLARKKYVFSYVALGMSIVMVLAIMFRHANIFQIVDTMFIISILNMIVTVIMHILYKYDQKAVKQFINSQGAISNA